MSQQLRPLPPTPPGWKPPRFARDMSPEGQRRRFRRVCWVLGAWHVTSGLLSWGTRGAVVGLISGALLLAAGAVESVRARRPAASP